MTIVEFAFVVAKSDEALRQELESKLPGVLSEQFSQLPKLQFAYVGKTLEAAGRDANSEGGICLHIQWQEVEAFDSFIASPGFADFKTFAVPYLAGPATPQLFDPSSSGTLLETTVDSLYLHVVKVFTSSDVIEQAQASKEAVQRKLEAFVGCVKNSSATNTPLASYCGSGLRAEDGACLAVTGWKDRESLDSALNNADIKRQLQHIQEIAGKDCWSSFVFGLQRIASASRQ